MEKWTDSDLTMLANDKFEEILSSIRNSNLNYSIQVSPFSATISLRKSLIKDKNGLVIIPRNCGGTKFDLQCENIALQSGDKLNSLLKYEELLSSYESTTKTITLLQKSLKERDDMIDDLVAKKKAGNKAVETLDAELSRIKVRFEEEKSHILQEHHNEVQVWKQDLNLALVNHKKLEEKCRKLSDNLSTVGPPSEELPLKHHNSTSSTQDDYKSTSEDHINSVTAYCVPDCSSVLNPLCPSCMNTSVNVEMDLSEPNSTFSSIASFRSHFVKPLDPGDVFLLNGSLFAKLEAQYQEERKNGCKQS